MTALAITTVITVLLLTSASPGWLVIPFSDEDETTEAPSVVITAVGFQRIGGRELLERAVCLDSRGQWREARSHRFATLPTFEAIGQVGVTRIGVG